MKRTLAEMKTAFDRLISRLDRVKERTGKLGQPSQKLPKLKLKKRKISKNCRIITKGVTHIKGTREGNKRKNI